MNTMQTMKTILAEVKRKKPVIECITNYVTIGDCANIILAAGASPIMAEDIREIKEIVSISGAVVLNIGTLQEQTVKAMRLAGEEANRLNIPVVLDPVGVGASNLRNVTAEMLLKNVQFSAIRGNLSEIKAIYGVDSGTKGVDAADGETVNDAAVDIVRAVAQRYDCTVAATGAQDIIASPERTAILENGHPMMADVTGTGCMCSSIVGAMCGGGVGDSFAEAVLAVSMMSISGEQAEEFVRAAGAGIGTFREKLFDYMYQFDAAVLEKRGKIREL